jgi:endonuclease YncB( thermonuclease family)
VERVIDGDTLVMENGERVGLIGVDTPETKHPPTSRLSTSAKRLLHSLSVWWKASVCGWS